MEVQRPTAALFWVKVDLPHLSQRVGLDEVPLVMDVEPVVDGVILELGYVPGDVDGCHVVEDSGGAASCSLGWRGDNG